MKMPPPDPAILKRRPELVARLRKVLDADGLIEHEDELRVFECDGLTAYQQPPMLVALPRSTEEVSRIMAICSEMNVKVVPRGAGTSLSGGALPLEDGLLLGLSRLTRILEVDFDNRCVVAQPGVTNLAITQAVEHKGFYYAPDPSSQIACTIGGNIAENAGGVHCLKYGLTTNNILGLEIVTMDGEVIRLGGKHSDGGGYDLVGLLTGSEGLLGIITEATVRILPRPETARAVLFGFDSIEDAGECVASVIGAGIIPAGMEMMDRLAIRAVEEYCHPGYPTDAAAVLIVELDGPESEVNEYIERVSKIARECRASSIRASESEEERLLIWKGRKSAFPAAGRLAPDYYCVDGTIPRGRLPEVLNRIAELGREYGLEVANVFHAGDGNLHPLILYDANKPGDLERAEGFGADVLRLCVKVGGVLTGEHGIGVEKRDLMGEMFDEDDLKQQERVKCAFDPEQRLNPGKMFPTLHGCAELGQLHVHGGEIPFGDLPRL